MISFIWTLPKCQIYQHYSFTIHFFFIILRHINKIMLQKCSSVSSHSICGDQCVRAHESRHQCTVYTPTIPRTPFSTLLMCSLPKNTREQLDWTFLLKHSISRKMIACFHLEQRWNYVLAIGLHYWVLNLCLELDHVNTGQAANTGTAANTLIEVLTFHLKLIGLESWLCSQSLQLANTHSSRRWQECWSLPARWET